MEEGTARRRRIVGAAILVTAVTAALAACAGPSDTQPSYDFILPFLD